MADNEEEKSEWNEEILVPLDFESEEEKKYDNGPYFDLRDYKPDYKARICPKCGREYEHDSLFCEEDGTKLYEIWKCRYCNEDLAKAQGYSEINVCPNCGKALDAMQKKSISGRKSGEANVLKRICTNEKCGVSYENNAKFCKKCGSPVVSMQCSCGEIFRQREDGSFDKHCPKCGSLNPVELEKKKIEAAIALRKKQEEEAEEARRKQEEEEKARQERIRRKKEAEEKAKRYKIGDRIQFGSYPFYEDGREKPIDWIILDKDSEGNALVISKYCLNARRFDAKSNNWERSEIRQWLNNEFYNGTFKDEEKNAILEYREAGCKVFLLSEEEAGKYFKNNEDRKAWPTPYAKGRGAYTNDARGGSCWWWLRSPGYDQDDAACVSIDGFVNAIGGYVDYGGGGVRAALKINLNNL